MKKLLFFFLFAYASYGQVGSSVSSKECDPIVKKELDAQGIEYTINKNGDFKIVRKLNNGRSQLVFIRSQSMNYKDIEVREIWSYARIYNTQADISGANIYMVLSKNATYKLGSWQIGKDNAGKYFLNFSVRADSNARGKVLEDFIDVVARQGDEIENELTNKDEY